MVMLVMCEAKHLKNSSIFKSTSHKILKSQTALEDNISGSGRTSKQRIFPATIRIVVAPVTTNLNQVWSRMSLR